MPFAGGVGSRVRCEHTSPTLPRDIIFDTNLLVQRANLM